MRHARAPQGASRPELWRNGSRGVQPAVSDPRRFGSGIRRGLGWALLLVGLALIGWGLAA